MFALGRIVWFGAEAMEFLRTLALVTPAALSRRPFLGREEGVVVECNFCWWRNNKSLLAKHRVHDWHSNGFSFVWERSWRLRCSSRANDRVHVAHTCGLGLSVFGGGKLGTVCVGGLGSGSFKGGGESEAIVVSIDHLSIFVDIQALTWAGDSSEP